MAQIVEVYPKIGCVTDSDPTGFVWTAAMRNGVQARIQGIADGFPGVTVDEWHLHADSGRVSPRGILTPKAVVWLSMPNSVTHADVVQGFVDDGFWPWAKQGIRNALPGGVVVTRWRGKLMTNLGKTVIDEAGP